MTATAELIKDATNEVIETAVKAPAKTKPAKKKKPIAKRNADKEIITYEGYELAQGADPKAIEEATKAANEALEQIQGTEANLLSSFMTFGEFQSNAAPMFKSTKLYGQYLKEKLPASQDMDPALRSNCKWLFEALNNADHEAADMLKVFGINRIEDFKSGNPTVIRREYKAAKKTADAEAKAQAEGFDSVEALEAHEKAAAETQAKKDAANAKRKLTTLEKKVVAFVMQQKSQEDTAQEAASLIRDLLETDPKEQLEKIESIVG